MGCLQGVGRDRLTPFPGGVSNPISSLNLEQRLCFHDAELIGKGMKGLNEQTACTGLDGHVANGCRSEPMSGSEAMEQSSAPGIGLKFVVYARIDFGGEPFHRDA